MGLGHMTSASSLLQMTSVVLLACLLLHVTSGFVLRETESALDDLNKRDTFMGLKLQCQAHPRNCNGGYQNKRTQQLKAREQDKRNHSLIRMMELVQSIKDILNVKCKNHPRNCKRGQEQQHQKDLMQVLQNPMQSLDYSRALLDAINEREAAPEATLGLMNKLRASIAFWQLQRSRQEASDAQDVSSQNWVNDASPVDTAW